MKKVGIGIIGCGARARGVTRDLLGHTSDVEVRSLYDPSAEAIESARQSIGGGARVCSEYREVVEDPGVDWVIIGSWNCFHREHAVAALDAGKHVFCEKPLATTLEDVLAIRDAHRRSKRQFFMGFTLRYSSHYRRIHQLLRDGAVGQVVSFEFNETLNFNHGGYIYQDWRRLTRNAGTHLLEKCCHDIDVANWCVGSLPARVASFGGLDFFTAEHAHHARRIGANPANGRPAYQNWLAANGNPFTSDKDIADNQVAIIEYANGVRATFHTNSNAALHERRSYILGTEGSIRADLICGRIELRRIGWDEPIVVYPSVAGAHGGGDEVMTRELADGMTQGAEPSATLADGLTSAITCFAIDQAMATGQVVDLVPLWQQAGVEPRLKRGQDD